MSNPNYRIHLSPDGALYAEGLDVGKLHAVHGQRLVAADDPTLPKARGMVAGWRLHNGLRTEPMVDDFDDDVWGPAPTPF